MNPYKATNQTAEIQPPPQISGSCNLLTVDMMCYIKSCLELEEKKGTASAVF